MWKKKKSRGRVVSCPKCGPDFNSHHQSLELKAVEEGYGEEEKKWRPKT